MRSAILFFCGVLFPFLLLGQDFETLVKKGDEYFEKRDRIESCLKAIKFYQKATRLKPEDNEIRLKLARLTHWTAGELGLETMDKNQRVEIFKIGAKACEEILAREPRNPYAHFWRMWNLAGETIAEGIFRGGYSFKEAIVGTIFAGNGDLDYFYGGIYRYWARVIYEIPGLLGRFFHFTPRDSVWLYQQALKVEPNFLMTRFWLAETYLKMKQKDKAIKELEYIVKTPSDILPEVEIENRFYQEQARKLLEKLR